MDESGMRNSDASDNRNKVSQLRNSLFFGEIPSWWIDTPRKTLLISPMSHMTKTVSFLSSLSF